MKSILFVTSNNWGIIVNTPTGKGNSIENVAEFGGLTLGERREQSGFSHKSEEYV